MSATCLGTRGEGEVTCKPKDLRSLTHMTLEVTRFTNGDVNVFIDRSRHHVLKSEDILYIQHAVETAFHELLASLPDDVCTQKKGA